MKEVDKCMTSHLGIIVFSHFKWIMNKYMNVDHYEKLNEAGYVGNDRSQ